MRRSPPGPLLFALAVIIALVATEGVSGRAATGADRSTIDARQQCPVTQVSDPPFVPPTPHLTAPSGLFWYGSNELWTLLPTVGAWEGLPRNDRGLRQKIFWWRPGFDGRVEPAPLLSVTGRRLDGPGSYVHPSPATNASSPDIGRAMLTGVDIPQPGCWELTGEYYGHALSFVIWIA